MSENEFLAFLESEYKYASNPAPYVPEDSYYDKLEGKAELLEEIISRYKENVINRKQITKDNYFDSYTDEDNEAYLRGDYN